MIWQLIPQPDAHKHYSPYIAVSLFCTFKSEQDSDLSILTGVYFVLSDRFDTVVLFYSVPWMYETGSCTVV
jgi:hypothetical protein